MSVPNAERAASVFRPRRPTLSIEMLVLLASLWISLTCNQAFWRAIGTGRDWSQPADWAFGLAILVAMTGIHALLLGLLVTRHLVKPILVIVLLIAAGASWFTGHYGVYLDPGMIRNTLHTESKEASDLISFGLIWHILVIAGPPILAILACRVRRRSLQAAIGRRLLAGMATLVAVAAALVVAYPGLAGPIRTHREIRYLLTPANLIWSTSRVALMDGRKVVRNRAPIATDAVRVAATPGRRPMLLLLFVGETARSANWGLNGYRRDTTPELRKRGVIPFDLTACGTDTETSVPCMFAPVGRRDYDEDRIRGSESLLHVLARVGYQVSWRDNQTGCKGVCDGLPFETIDDGRHPDCPPGRCLDIRLLDGLEQKFDGQDHVVVLHMIGSHGPAYDARYPTDAAHYQPICGQVDARGCSQEAIVNSYDNSIRYTDQVLAAAIDQLAARADTHDVAMLFLSDHGESLGEHRLYLHGIPWRIAPREQTQVPMVLWMSAGFRDRLSLDTECLRRRAQQPATHDVLFHTVLGMLEVSTRTREPSLDLVSPCRRD